jgi:hypothetical protein
MRDSERIEKLLEVEILDEWTRGFCESLLNQTTKGRKLSDRQQVILRQKEEEFNDDAVKDSNDWRSSWGDENEEIFRVCAMYYRNTGYFRNLADKVDHHGNLEEGWVPPKRAYNKMCNNKYAMKVRKAWFDEPKFPVGSLVAVRSTAPKYTVSGQPLRVHKNGKTIVYFVVETNSSAPRSACAGAKRYTVVAAGSSVPHELEERYLKKMRKTKKK